MGRIVGLLPASQAQLSGVGNLKGKQAASPKFGDILIPRSLNQEARSYPLVAKTLFPAGTDGGTRHITSLAGDTVSLGAQDVVSMMGRQPQTYVLIEGPPQHRDRLRQDDEAKVADFLNRHGMAYVRYPHSNGHYIGDLGEALRFTDQSDVFTALARGGQLMNRRIPRNRVNGNDQNHNGLANGTGSRNGRHLVDTAN